MSCPPSSSLAGFSFSSDYPLPSIFTFKRTRLINGAPLLQLKVRDNIMSPLQDLCALSLKSSAFILSTMIPSNYAKYNFA